MSVIFWVVLLYLLMFFLFFFFLMVRGPPRSTQSRSSAASDVYKRQHMGMLRFSKFFGSDYYTRGSKYTKSRRQKHLRALNRLIFLGFFESGDKKEKKEPVDVLLSTLFGI